MEKSNQRKDYLKELKEKADIAYSKKPEDRSYKERYDIWIYEKYLKNKPNDWDEGEEFDILDGEGLANNKFKNPFDNSDYPDWFRETGNWFGKKVKYMDEIYKLLGLNVTFVDYYYILQDNEGKKHYCSCVGKIELL